MQYNIITTNKFADLRQKFDSIILAVSHNEFVTIDYNSLKKNKSSIIYDIKGVLNNDIIDGHL
jgi:UDP-N-acetyl-D-galactosamine dehydrogenase